MSTTAYSPKNLGTPKRPLSYQPASEASLFKAWIWFLEVVS